MKKICKRCSNQFSDKESNNNFFSKYPNNGINLDIACYIKDTYDNCLCPSCLNDTILYFDTCEVNPIYLHKVKR